MMKNSKIYQILLVLIVFSLIFFFKCKKDNVPPAEINDQFEKIDATWNSISELKNKAQLTSWKIADNINNSSTKNDVINKMTDLGTMRMMNFNKTLNTYELVLLSDVQNLISTENINKYKQFLNDQIQIGDDSYEVTWSASGNSFKTIAIKTKEGLIFDSMLSSIIVLADNKLPNNNITTKSASQITDGNSFSDEVYWIFTDVVRGSVSATVGTICDSNGNAINCTSSCSAIMVIGQAQSNCNNPVSSGSCCSMSYAFALATPFVNITYNTETLKFEVTGIGSSATWSGTLVDCCHSGGAGG